MFKFIIDNVEYQNPINWKDFSETIEYSEASGVFAPKYTEKLTFTGDAFNYLYGLKRSVNFCYSATIEIKERCGDTFETVLNGTIYIAACRFDLKHKTVEVTVDDNNISALVFNNKNIKVNITGLNVFPHLSKNGVNVGYDGALDDQTDGQFFNPATGVYGGGINFCYRAYTLFKRIIEFITDGQVGFKSDLLDFRLPVITPQDRAKYFCVVRGENIRYNIGLGGTAPSGDLAISFDDLYRNLNTKFPLAIGIEYDATGKPIIRIEHQDFFRTNSASIEIPYVDNLEEFIDLGLLYSKIQVGSDIADFDSSLHDFEPAPTYTFGKEEYFLAGQCNIDTYKDMFATFIYDTNIIQELGYTNTSNNQYDAATFVVEMDIQSVTPTGPNGDAIQAINPFNSSYHYNDTYMNRNLVSYFVFGADLYYSDGTGSVLLQSSNSGAYYVNVFNFDSPVSHEKYATLKANLMGNVTFYNEITQQKKGWIRSVTRKYYNGETKFEMISNINNS